MAGVPEAGNDWIRGLLGLSVSDERIMNGTAHEYTVHMEGQEFMRAAENLAHHKFVLIGLFASEGFSDRGRFSVFTVFERKQDIFILIRDVDRNAASVAGLFPSASWSERECQDGFGITFDGSFDSRHLLQMLKIAAQSAFFIPLHRFFLLGPDFWCQPFSADRLSAYRVHLAALRSAFVRL